MQAQWKSEPRRRRRQPWITEAARLGMPATGMESEFNVVLDGAEIDPRAYWKDPTAFIDVPLLRRERSSLQLPTGGAVYFDRGVIEVVTPVIELAPGCTARVVRNLWEQIAFIRSQLTKWGERTGHNVRLKAYSTHYNISFELRKDELDEHRNIQKLALLLAYILPIPVAVLGTNRRSTGVGVRPREDRIEVTVDFTPDPGLMITTATLIVGIVREVMTWPSYELDELDRRPIPTVADVVPGKHTTRKGWLTKDLHYPQSPYTCDIDERLWRARDGRILSLREIARGAAWYFRLSIRRFGDAFSVRHLFAVLSGRAPSMLELPDRPFAYEDVGRSCQWGMVLPGLRALARGEEPPPEGPSFDADTYEAFVAQRQREREEQQAAPSAPAPKVAAGPDVKAPVPVHKPLVVAANRGNGREHSGFVSLAGAMARRGRSAAGASDGRVRGRRRIDNPVSRAVPAPRARKRARAVDRRGSDRRILRAPVPFPDRRLTRSAYEQVFLKLVSGGRLKIGAETYKPVSMRGWDQAVFRRDSDGRQRLLSIDQLLARMDDWMER